MFYRSSLLTMVTGARASRAPVVENSSSVVPKSPMVESTACSVSELRPNLHTTGVAVASSVRTNLTVASPTASVATEPLATRMPVLALFQSTVVPAPTFAHPVTPKRSTTILWLNAADRARSAAAAGSILTTTSPAVLVVVSAATGIWVVVVKSTLILTLGSEKSVTLNLTPLLVLPPAEAVTVAVPAPMPLTSPSPLTETMPGGALAHVTGTFISLSSASVTTAVNVLVVPPTTRANGPVAGVLGVTATLAALPWTLTSNVITMPRPTAATVISAVPILFAVITPLSTETLSSSDSHVNRIPSIGILS